MKHPLVFQSDFGYVDGAVSAMYGVAYGVDPSLNISNLTHEITPFDIWEASYRLIQTVNYWPAGTVFVSVVDPGVGSSRRSIAVKTTTGQYIITPDNGSLTHIKRMTGIAEARTIDETVNRLQGSSESYTFHGRDIFAYTGARLAAGIIDFAGVGPEIPVESVVELPVVEAELSGDTVSGTIDVLDVRFGSLGPISPAPSLPSWESITAAEWRSALKTTPVPYIRISWSMPRASPMYMWANPLCMSTAWIVWLLPSIRAASPVPITSAPAPTGRSAFAKRPVLFMNKR